MAHRKNRAGSFPLKGIPVIAQDARNERNPRRNRRRRRRESDSPRDNAAPLVDRVEQAPPKREPERPETAFCIYGIAPVQEQPPFHVRQGLATVRPREVERRGNKTLLCDGLHDGPHEWPLTLMTIDVDRDGLERALAGNRVDEGKEFVE